MSFAILKYINIPQMSLLVVINGPVAMAGSIPCLSKIIGTKVPIKEAIIITEIREIPIVNPKLTSNPKRKIPPTISKIAKTTPLNKLNTISLKSLLSKEPFKLLFAKPCKTIAEDCTPTFPAIAAIKGTKKEKCRMFLHGIIKSS